MDKTTARPPRPRDGARFEAAFFALAQLEDMRRRAAHRHLAAAHSWRLYETYFPATFRRRNAAEQLARAGEARRALLRVRRLKAAGVTGVTPAYAAAYGLR